MLLNIYLFKKSVKHKKHVKLCTLNLSQEKEYSLYRPGRNGQRNAIDIEGDRCIKWYSTCYLAPKCTKSTRLVEFHFNLLHRRSENRPNHFLTKIGIKDCPNCSFCNLELEHLTLFFLSCSKVTTFWNPTTYSNQNYLTELQNKYFYRLWIDTRCL